MGLESSVTRNFLRVGFFQFSKLESYFLKYNNFFKVSVSWIVRNFFVVSISRIIRKVFFWENVRSFFGVFVSWNMRNFLILELESSIFPQYKKIYRGRCLFIFSSLGWKVQDSITGNKRKAVLWENIRNFVRAGFF